MHLLITNVIKIVNKSLHWDKEVVLRNTALIFNHVDVSKCPHFSIWLYPSEILNDMPENIYTSEVCRLINVVHGISGVWIYNIKLQPNFSHKIIAISQFYSMK